MVTGEILGGDGEGVKIGWLILLPKVGSLVFATDWSLVHVRLELQPSALSQSLNLASNQEMG